MLSDLYRVGWSASAAIWKLDENREQEWRSLISRVFELEQMIECFEKDDATELTKVISYLQVLFARTDMLLDGRTLRLIENASDAVDVGGITLFRTDRVIQWIQFMALIESGFAFARGDQERLKLDHTPENHRILEILRFRVDVNAEQHPLWTSIQTRLQALNPQQS